MSERASLVVGRFDPPNPVDVERLLRQEWWLNHGHGPEAQYGDDGEMQCAACPMDFRREPLASLYNHILITRLLRRTTESEALLGE